MIFFSFHWQFSLAVEIPDSASRPTRSWRFELRSFWKSWPAFPYGQRLSPLPSDRLPVTFSNPAHELPGPITTGCARTPKRNVNIPWHWFATNLYWNTSKMGFTKGTTHWQYPHGLSADQQQLQQQNNNAGKAAKAISILITTHLQNSKEKIHPRCPQDNSSS